jgi:hypothetical protein
MRKFLSLIMVGILSLLVLSACGSNELEQQASKSVSSRTEMFSRAEKLYPMPTNSNFPVRKLLVKYTERQDMINHPWYTYILGDNGNIVFYFVSTTLPVNSCAFLSSTEAIVDRSEGDLVLTAPSTDGIYYGGSGASSACNGWIFEDATTGAIGLVFGTKIMTFDAPLILEAEPVLIQPGVQ